MANYTQFKANVALRQGIFGGGALRYDQRTWPLGVA